jgi:hypothetical protein
VLDHGGDTNTDIRNEITCTSQARLGFRIATSQNNPLFRPADSQKIEIWGYRISVHGR